MPKPPDKLDLILGKLTDMCDEFCSKSSSKYDDLNVVVYDEFLIYKFTGNIDYGTTLPFFKDNNIYTNK